MVSVVENAKVSVEAKQSVPWLVTLDTESVIPDPIGGANNIDLGCVQRDRPQDRVQSRRCLCDIKIYHALVGGQTKTAVDLFQCSDLPATGWWSGRVPSSEDHDFLAGQP